MKGLPFMLGELRKPLSGSCNSGKSGLWYIKARICLLIVRPVLDDKHCFLEPIKFLRNNLSAFQPLFKKMALLRASLLEASWPMPTKQQSSPWFALLTGTQMGYTI